MNDKNKSTVYLVDSENVNDVWIQLVTVMDPQDEILVFYTENNEYLLIYLYIISYNYYI